MDEKTIQKLRETFSYDPLSGVLVRRFIAGSDTPKKFLGKPAGSLSKYGYVKVRFFKKMYQAHRLIWLYVYGELPEYVDHINGVRSDNRLANLRACRPFENQQNRKVQKNATGLTGVRLDKRDGTYRSEITFRGQRKHLGTFRAAEDAYSAYLAAKRNLHQFNPSVRLAPLNGKEG